MVATNSQDSSLLPEIQAMKQKIRMRFLSLITPWLVVLLVVLGRTGVYTFNFSGVVGTSLLILSLAAIAYLTMDKSTFLPFLGETVLPPSAIVLKTPVDASFTVTVHVPRTATHVMYWASESGSGTAPNPYDAYGNFTNAGVVTVQDDGSASLLVRCPQQYMVHGRSLPRHIHYREIYKSGIAGPVKTTPIVCL